MFDLYRPTPSSAGSLIAERRAIWAAPRHRRPQHETIDSLGDLITAKIRSSTIARADDQVARARHPAARPLAPIAPPSPRHPQGSTPGATDRSSSSRSPGHGGEDPGAVGPGGTREEETWCCKWRAEAA